MSRKVSDELISAYLDGELTAEEQALVEQAIREDHAAARLFDELRAVRAGLQSLPAQQLDDAFAQRVLRAAERQMLTGSAPDAVVASNLPATTLQTTPDALRLRRWQRGFWLMATVAASLLILLSLNLANSGLPMAQRLTSSRSVMDQPMANAPSSAAPSSAAPSSAQVAEAAPMSAAEATDAPDFKPQLRSEPPTESALEMKADGMGERRVPMPDAAGPASGQAGGLAGGFGGAGGIGGGGGAGLRNSAPRGPASAGEPALPGGPPANAASAIPPSARESGDASRATRTATAGGQAPGAGAVAPLARRSPSDALNADRAASDLNQSQSARDSGLSIVQLDLANDPQARSQFFQALAAQAIDLAGDDQHALNDADNQSAGRAKKPAAEELAAVEPAAEKAKAKRADDEKDAANKQTELVDRKPNLADDNDAAIETDLVWIEAPRARVEEAIRQFAESMPAARVVAWSDQPEPLQARAEATATAADKSNQADATTVDPPTENPSLQAAAPNQQRDSAAGTPSSQARMAQARILSPSQSALPLNRALTRQGGSNTEQRAMAKGGAGPAVNAGAKAQDAPPEKVPLSQDDQLDEPPVRYLIILRRAGQRDALPAEKLPARDKQRQQDERSLNQDP